MLCWFAAGAVPYVVLRERALVSGPGEVRGGLEGEVPGRKVKYEVLRNYQLDGVSLVTEVICFAPQELTVLNSLKI